MLTVHLGLAALLGAFTRQAETPVERALLALGALLYFGSSLWLPLSSLPKVAGWLAAAALFTYFAKRPLPEALPARLAWLYASIAMLLILMWSATQSLLFPAITLGGTAAWASVLAWRRGLGFSRNP